MRYSTLALALALTVTHMTIASADTKITLYSGDFDAVSSQQASANMPGLAQVANSFARELPRGSSEISLDRLPVAIDIGSVQLIPESAGVRIASQRYDFSLIDQNQLLQQAVGERVTVEQTGGGKSQRFSGTLLAAGNGLTLQTDDGRIRVLADYSSFELDRLPANLGARPSLRWNVDSSRAGRENFRLDYATGGLAWQAEYLIQLDGPAQHGKAQMSGAAQVVNRSGLDYPGTRLTLVAGSPNRVRSAAPESANMVMMAAPKMARASMQYDEAPEAEDSAEYHAYPLRQPVDLPNGSVQRVSLLDPTSGINFKRHYVVGSSNGGYRPPRPQVHSGGFDDQLPVHITLELQNTDKEGLGIPLPEGRVRVFQNGNDDDALLGEARLGHTASGQTIRLDLGEAFDLNARRKQLAFSLAADRLSLNETVEITLANAKSSAVTVRVNESLARWQDWEIVSSSNKWNKENSQTISFDVDVPAGKETTVRYEVRYRWPADVRP